MRLARPLENLIDELMKLPSIGPKTAQRMALYILKAPEADVRNLAKAIIEAKEKIAPCSNCGYLTDTDPCALCLDDKRDSSILCVAEEASNIIAIEKTGFNGRYFVINQKFSLMDDNEIDNATLERFKTKLAAGSVQEVVLALNPDIEGEVVTRYLARIANQFNIKITRLAHGLPVGGDIEYADEITLRRAIEGRHEF
ncbi:MAG TPA: recombination mediator RecR [Syntrophomonadaceae bacterium]|nr:recombination mediator RecR [Syntrophomonadaceae bacterium]HNX29881.1 recombination mediator RecR [Syntrophomonadaceae bacterium]HPR93940.1 recombination mediator RecR [Syntrophomonadaceae bacterium]